jgi:hypothetical protein
MHYYIVCGLCFYVDYAPYVAPTAWTMLPLCCSVVASVAWTMWSFYAFAYACFYDTSMGHYTWYLVPCNERSLSNTYECSSKSRTLSLPRLQ